MKKLLLSFFALSLMFAPMKKADAGILLISSGGAAGIIAGSIIVGGTLVTFPIPSAAVSAIVFSSWDNGPVIISTLALLVANSEDSNVSEVVLQEYPSISPYAANELEYLVQEKSAALDNKEAVEVLFSEEEAQSILELTEESSDEDLSGLYKLMTKTSFKK